MTDARHHNRGFTLTELLVVIAVIALLTSISFVAFANAFSVSRVKATRSTILKLHGLIQQRVEAMNRSLDRMNLQPAVLKMQNDLKQIGLGNVTPTQRTCEILTRKQIYQLRFPQNFNERDITDSNLNPQYVPANHRRETESSALLYWVLTKSDVFGVAPVDESDFSSAEVRDTDGDGLMEFVDAWGQPLRFYRWPTQLIRSGLGTNPPGITSSPSTFTTVDRTYDTVLWAGLPAPSSVAGAVDPLARDPDDPTSELLRFVQSSGSKSGAVMTTIQNRFHTPNTYHAFLIVSPGPDNDLGLGEPYDYGTGSSSGPDTTSLISTNPALGTIGQGRLATLTTYVELDKHPIVDNLTNRQR